MYDKIEELSINNNLVDIPKDLNSIIDNKKNNLLSIPIGIEGGEAIENSIDCLLYTSPSPRDGLLSRMPSSA